jgi:hypothetical protein
MGTAESEALNMNSNCLGILVPDEVVERAREQGCVGGVAWVYRDGEYGGSPPKASIGCTRATRFRRQWWDDFKVELAPGWVAFKSPSGAPQEPRGVLNRSSKRATPTEGMMALETYELLRDMGLKPHFRVDICSGISGQFSPGTYEHGLPVYSRQLKTCFTDKARQVGRPDLIVVDKIAKTVELMVEFETNTNPKNLLGNYFCVFLAEEYKPKNEPTVYKFNARRTTHFLLACVRSRSPTPNEQAALEKGRMVANWLEKTSVLLAGNAEISSISKAHASASDDWQAMKIAFGLQVRSACAHLF